MPKATVKTKKEKVGTASSAAKVIASPAKASATPEPQPTETRQKFLGILGSKRVVRMRDVVINSITHTEILDEAGSIFILSDRDLKLQLKPLE